MFRFIKKLKTDVKGAVTVLVTLLLIPSILVTGTGVDLATTFAARSTVRNSNELALNALLSDYDQLLRDLYGLFAVTEGDAELQALVNRYIALTLFGEDNRTEGRVLYNNIGINAYVSPVDGANLANQAILRRQIEEYVRLRAPTFLIEEVLTSLEKFTRFLPDLQATIMKLDVVEQLGILLNLQMQLYYRIYYHERYLFPAEMAGNVQGLTLAEIQNWIATADAHGIEVDHAALITASLTGLNGRLNNLTSLRQTFFQRQQAYEAAVASYLSIRNSPPHPEASPEAWAAWSAAVGAASARMSNARAEMNAVRAEFYQLRSDTSYWAGEEARRLSMETFAAVENRGEHSFGSFVSSIQNMADVRRHEIHGVFGWILGVAGTPVNPFYIIREFDMQRVSQRSDADNVQVFLDNLVQMEMLITLIDMQAASVVADINRLQRHLDRYASNAMREGMSRQLAIIEPTIDMTAIQAQHRNITNFIDGYFLGYATYLANPELNVNGQIMTLAHMSAIIESINLQPGNNPPAFEALRNTHRIEAIPYFQHLRRVDGTQFMGFTDCDMSFIFFIQMFGMFGDETHFQRRAIEFANMPRTFLSVYSSEMMTLISDLTQAYHIHGRGALEIPADVYAQLGGRVNMMGAIVFTGDAFGYDDNIWRKLRSTNIMLSAVEEAFRVFLEEDGVLNQLSLVSYASGMFSSFTTQDGTSFTGNSFHPNVNYLLGWELEYLLIGSRIEYVNHAAFNSILFSTRFVFNLISSFVVPNISAMVVKEKTQTVRMVLVLCETLIDMYRLRSGESVPIVKFLNSHWIFANPTGMGQMAMSTVNSFTLGHANAVMMGVLAAYANSHYPVDIKDALKPLNPSNVYKNGILYVAIARTVYNRGLMGSSHGVMDEIKTQFIEEGLRVTLDKWENNFGGIFNDTLEDNLVPVKINKIMGRENSKANTAIAEKIAGYAIDVAVTNVVSICYHQYLQVFLFFVPPVVVVDRMQNLITLNMTNTVQNANSPVPPRIPALPIPNLRPTPLSLDAGEMFDLSQAHTAFTLETEVDLELLFLSGFIAQGQAGNVSSGTLTFNTVSNRGY